VCCPRLYHKPKKAQFNFLLKPEGYFRVASIGIGLDPKKKERIVSGINCFALR